MLKDVESVNDHVFTDETLTPYARDLVNESGVVTFDAEHRRELAELAHRNGLVETLKKRRLDLLPPFDEGSPYTGAQGRESGDSTTAHELSDLIASIATMGVLQPILVEETFSRDGKPERYVVSGERRLRAVRWGFTHLPDNQHFKSIPAIIVPGPLSDEDKRSWQLIENLAREDLKPGELAGALLFERCAILVTKLLSHSIAVPRDILALDDPVARFERLEKLRGNNPSAAAPWSEVIRRLGLQVTPRKARQLVAAFKALPPNISEEMDSDHVALATRIRFVELRKGREEAADGIWAAVKNAEGNNRNIFSGAINAALENPNIDAEEAVRRATEVNLLANQSRRESLASDPTLYGAPAKGETWESEVTDDGDMEDRADISLTSPYPQNETPPIEDAPTPDLADPEVVKAAIESLRSLVSHLAEGFTPARYDSGSLRIQARRLLDALDNPTPSNKTTGTHFEGIPAKMDDSSSS